MLVPVSSPYPLEEQKTQFPVGTVERMLVPGAAMSTTEPKSLLVGGPIYASWMMPATLPASIPVTGPLVNAT